MSVLNVGSAESCVFPRGSGGNQGGQGRHRNERGPNHRPKVCAPTACEQSLTSPSWIHRDDNDLAEMQAQRRPGRPSSSREDSLRQRIAAEEKEYKSGFWVPKITDSEAHKRLREWQGDWGSLNTLRFIRVKADGQVVESCFPPNGLS